MFGLKNKIRTVTSGSTFFWIVIGIIIIGALFARASLYKKDERVIRVGNATIAVELAQSPEAREKGLSGHDPLPDHQGMLFIFPNLGRPGFWMKDVDFPIDIIWIKDNRVADITPDIPTPKNGDPLAIFYPKEPINYVLEVNAGYAKKEGIKVGDTVSEIPLNP